MKKELVAVVVAGVFGLIGNAGCDNDCPSAITTPSILPTGAVGSPYFFPLEAATCDMLGETWSTSGGPAPPGLSLSEDGDLDGVPSAAGTFGFTARVELRRSNREHVIVLKDFTLTIEPRAAGGN